MLISFMLRIKLMQLDNSKDLKAKKPGTKQEQLLQTSALSNTCTDPKYEVILAALQQLTP